MDPSKANHELVVPSGRWIPTSEIGNEINLRRWIMDEGWKLYSRPRKMNTSQRRNQDVSKLNQLAEAAGK